MSVKHSNKDNQLISQQRELAGQNVRELIKWLRSRDNLTQTEFAQRVGINRSLICQYESGERLPSMESIIKLAVYICEYNGWNSKRRYLALIFSK